MNGRAPGILSDTIAAISTPLGEGGLAVIRISGPEAFAVAERCFQPVGAHSCPPTQAPSHTVHYGRLIRAGETVDEVMLTVLRAPRTFTREDVVEISCHGGLLPAKAALDAVLACGARSARPGEFTERAFLNGRIDLAQAEAVMDLIQARTEVALAAAREQLAGKLSQRIENLRERLMRVLAHIEAHLDFPDEDIAPETRGQLLGRLRDAGQFVAELLRHGDEGRILRRGARAAIVGRPNAGKSCLLNQLAGRDRAIVSPIPGTTRDTIEETANIRGIPVVFIDTAGLRESGDAIEMEGIRRSRAALEQAEFILHVLDLSAPLQPEDLRYFDEFRGKKQIRVLNKVDLPRKLELPPDAAPAGIEVSCLTGDGLDKLREAIRDLIWGGKIRLEMLETMINARHQNALERTHEALERAAETLQSPDAGLELSALELRIAVNAVGEIVGKTATEDLLDAIFSQFCIGK